MKKFIVGLVVTFLVLVTSVCSAMRLPKVPVPRIIYLQGPITVHTGMEITKRLDRLDRTSGDIRIVITTPGGCVMAGLMIIDAMDRCHNDIQTYVNGFAYSMGIYIASSGTKGKRVISKHGQTLIHGIRIDYMFRTLTLEDLKIDYSYMKRHQQTLNVILSTNTGLSIVDINKLSEKEDLLSAKKTIKLNVVDGIYEGEK